MIKHLYHVLMKFERLVSITVRLYIKGTPTNQCQANQKDMVALETQQNQLLMVISQQQQTQLQMGQQMGLTPEQQQMQMMAQMGLTPEQQQMQMQMMSQMGNQQQVNPGTGLQINPEMAEDAKELQEEQQELLNDILKQQSTETDPERLQELFRQQNNLLQQMQQLQNAGFQYPNGIPPPQAPNFNTSTDAKPQAVPMAATY